jgi:hypothetical protein
MSGLFKTQKPPKPAPPVPMPDPEDAEARKARRLQMENAQKRAGRESTILSGEATGDYSKKTLG